MRQPDVGGDGGGGARMIAGGHDQRDLRHLRVGDGSRRRGADLVAQRDQSDQLQTRGVGVDVGWDGGNGR
jgi:hypothetical protein